MTTRLPTDAPLSILDAVPAHIAILDADGVIRHVNAAWRRFAAANAMTGTEFGVGEDYLALCDRADGDCSVEASHAARGIRQVISGALTEFVLEYPCHSPDEARWFRMIATPFGTSPRRGAMVMHVNITGPELDAQALRSAERQALDSERRLKFALEAADIGDWSLDLRTNDAHRSLRHDQCFGYSELLPTWSYDTFLAHVSIMDRERVDACFKQAMAGEGEYSSEFRTVWPDGTEHWLWTRGSFYFDEQGAPVRVAGIVMDITERKDAERLAAHALDRLNEAQRVGKIGDWEFDLVSGRITWSHQVFEIMGRDPALGTPQGIEELARYFDAPSTALQNAKIAELIATKSSQQYDLVVVRPTGETVNVYAFAIPRFDEHGEVVGLYGTVQDITSRKRAEATAERLANIVASSDDAIIGKNLNSIITSWNRGAEKVFGYTADEMVGTSILALIPHDRLSEERHILDRVGSGLSVEHFETVRRRKDGRMIDVSVTASPIRDSDGTVIGVSKVARDISDRKRLEQQFLRAQRMESIGTLAGGIAHDLNNVLTPIIMSLEILKTRFADHESQELIATIDRSAQHGADMVQQVLSFARGVEGQRLRVDVVHLVQDIEKIARDTFLKHVDVQSELPGVLWGVIGDPTQLHQVLLNLCVNARDAMPDGGTLLLSAENVTLDDKYAQANLDAVAGSFVCIRVADTGCGIAAEHAEQIFDPFFTTKEVGKGTGLGLSTSQAIVKSHGGFLHMYSEPGRGTTFSVYLPADTAPAETDRETPLDLPRGSGERILVVDDEPSIRQITKRTLEAFGYRVVLAADGAEAVATFAREHDTIDVVLTDMTMPVMDGPATIRVLRKMDPRVRIIAASGLDARGNVAGLDVQHFLPKPYSAELLLRLLRTVLTPTPPA